MIPGLDETLRANGTARLSCHDEHLQRCAGEKRRARVVIEVSVAEVYLHCAKALMRSALWDLRRGWIGRFCPRWARC